MNLRKLIVALLLFTVTMAMASPLTPDEALNAALGHKSTVVNQRLRAKAATMQLAYVVGGESSPTVYVFAQRNKNNPGFIVVSADDAAIPLLGYSDEGTFDADNMPPQMQWWLQACGATIEELVTNQSLIYNRPLASTDIKSADGAKRLPAKAPKAAIAPLCSTKWYQDAPYNNECPIRKGERCVTGCVATAMAQVMKFHRWPQKGTGTHTYSYTINYVQYQESLDFGATTFDWDNMCDSYKSGYTAEQASAVATLMHACGVASDMEYGIESSAANSNDAASGMIDYLGYDLASCIQYRAWYSASDWDDMIYGEIAARRPVLYSGHGTQGHSFICDGYDGSGYYHINWGWGGISDGYFLLSELNPFNQGIGGDPNKKGYNNEQNAMIGVCPAQPGSKRPLIFKGTDLTTPATSYNVNQNVGIKICTDNAFYNYSTAPVKNIHFGLRLVNNGTSTIIDSYCHPNELKPCRGIYSYSVKTTDLPQGRWRAYPVVSADGQNWVPIKFDLSRTAGYLDMEVTSSTVTIKGASNTTPDYSDVTTELTGSNINGECYTDNTYTLSYSFTSDKAFSVPYTLILVNQDSKTVAGLGEQKTVTAENGGTVNADFSIAIPTDIDLSANYALSLCVNEGNAYTVIHSKPITIKSESQATKVDITLLSIEPEGTSVLYPDNTYTFNFEFTPNGSMNTDYYLLLVNKTDWVITAKGDSKNVSTTQSGTVSKSFQIKIPANINLEKEYSIALCTLEGDNYNIKYTTDISIESFSPEVEFSIKAISPDDDAFYLGSTYDITFGIKSNVAQKQTYYAILVDYGEKLTLLSGSTPMQAVWTTPGEISCSCQLQIPEDLDINRKYVLFIATLDGDTYYTETGWYITLAEPVGGIGSVIADDIPRSYYDLQGRPVANPRPGNIYIERTAAGSRKVMFK